jgi:hypothetical protein
LLVLPLYFGFAEKIIILFYKMENITKPEITRLEVINHAKNDKPTGRILTLYQELGDFKSIELSYQDGGRTLKIFLD